MTLSTLCKPSSALGLTSMGQQGSETLREQGLHVLLSMCMHGGCPD